MKNFSIEKMNEYTFEQYYYNHRPQIYDAKQVDKCINT